MSKFNRDFPVADVLGSMNENPWFGDLLRRWQPAGGSVAQAPDANEGSGVNLRLAVRDNYLNLYQAGQSIARVDFVGKRRLRAHIHEKYIHGREATGQDYVVLTSEGYVDRSGARRAYGGIGDLDTWIEGAKAYGGREKAFVEQVVSRNENVIDLEMALPAYRDEASQRSAPRMDIVALERDGLSWRIVFWEAKLVKDPRARCRDTGEPEVCRQLKSYTDWLDHGDHREVVKSAYANACRVLVGMHEIAKSFNPDIRPLGEAIAAVGSASAGLTVDDKPRLLIDDRIADASFRTNNHLQKLLDLGHHVQVVEEGGDMRLRLI